MSVNTVRLENNQIIFNPYDGDEIVFGDISCIDTMEGSLVLPNGVCLPIDGLCDGGKEILDMFIKLYPNGKPLPQVEPTLYTPTAEERLQALEMAMNDLLLGGM